MDNDMFWLLKLTLNFKNLKFFPYTEEENT